MYSVGPFPSTVNPARIGVYHTTPCKTGGGGYGYWDGKKWNRYCNWGGWYWENKREWYWYGLTEAQSKDPFYKRSAA